MSPLVVVATPIGNLGDLSPRAVATLAGADAVCCEDTRRTRALLSAAGVHPAPTLVSLHRHNEAARVGQVLDWCHEGRTIALVTDAGTPAVSDPGSRLLAAAAASGVTVTVVPGPSAVLAALVVSGLPTERFCVEGFLPGVAPLERSNWHCWRWSPERRSCSRRRGGWQRRWPKWQRSFPIAPWQCAVSSPRFTRRYGGAPWSPPPPRWPTVRNAGTGCEARWCS